MKLKLCNYFRDFLERADNQYTTCHQINETGKIINIESKLIYNLSSTNFAALPRFLIAVASPNFTTTISQVSGMD